MGQPSTSPLFCPEGSYRPLRQQPSAAPTSIPGYLSTADAEALRWAPSRVAVAAVDVRPPQTATGRVQTSTGHPRVPHRGQGLHWELLLVVEAADTAVPAEPPFRPGRGQDHLGDVAVAGATMADVEAGAKAEATIVMTIGVEEAGADEHGGFPKQRQHRKPTLTAKDEVGTDSPHHSFRK